MNENKRNNVLQYCSKRKNISFFSLMAQNDLTYAEAREILCSFLEDGVFVGTGKEDEYAFVPEERREKRSEKIAREMSDLAKTLSVGEARFWVRVMRWKDRFELTEFCNEEKEEVQSKGKTLISSRAFTVNNGRYAFALTTEEYFSLYDELDDILDRVAEEERETRRAAEEAKKRTGGVPESFDDFSALFESYSKHIAEVETEDDEKEKNEDDGEEDFTSPGFLGEEDVVTLPRSDEEEKKREKETKEYVRYVMQKDEAYHEKMRTVSERFRTEKVAFESEADGNGAFHATVTDDVGKTFTLCFTFSGYGVLELNDNFTTDEFLFESGCIRTVERRKETDKLKRKYGIDEHAVPEVGKKLYTKRVPREYADGAFGFYRFVCDVRKLASSK